VQANLHLLGKNKRNMRLKARRNKARTISISQPLVKPIPKREKVFDLLPSIHNLMVVYNVGFDTLSDFLFAKGYPQITIQSKINSRQHLNLIHEQFVSQKNLRDKVRGPSTINWKIDESKASINVSIIEDYTGNMKNENVKTDIVSRLLYLEENRFDTIKQTVRYKKETIQSKFSDSEALSVCKKMCSSFTRNVCKNFETKKNDREFHRFQIHFIANKALKLYGGEVMTFWYNLRPLKFKNQSAFEVNTYIKVIPDFPMITLKSKDFSCNVSFFLKQNKIKNQLQPNIRVFSTKRGHIAYLDPQGYILDKTKKFSPRLQLFFEASRSGNFLISSGVETGNCEICNKPLTDTRSLRMGIGPVCASNLGIDLSFYQ
jgi:hypothetical protein